MSTIYLENHTVEFTTELWSFCQSFKFETTMVPLLLDPVYDTLELRGIPSDYCNRATIKTHRLDRTHVRMTIDMYYTKLLRNGRTAGWRTVATMDTEADISQEAATYCSSFDLRGNVMNQSHVALADRPEVRSALMDIIDVCQNAFVFIQQVLRFSPLDLELHEEELPVKEVKHSGKKKSKSKTPQVATTRTYRCYRIKRDYDFTERNPIVRQCRLWYVRKHKRRLSDGRVIDIDPYYKGVDRAFVKPEDGDFGRQIKVRPVTVEGGKADA